MWVRDGPQSAIKELFRLKKILKTLIKPVIKEHPTQKCKKYISEITKILNR